MVLRSVLAEVAVEEVKVNAVHVAILVKVTRAGLADGSVVAAEITAEDFEV